MISFLILGLTIKMAKSSKHHNKHDTVKLWWWLRCRWHQKCCDARWHHCRIDTVCWDKHVRLWNGRNSTLGWIRRLRWREKTALNQKNNTCDRNGNVSDSEEKGDADGLGDIFDRERWLILLMILGYSPIQDSWSGVMENSAHGSPSWGVSIAGKPEFIPENNFCAHWLVQTIMHLIEKWEWGLKVSPPYESWRRYTGRRQRPWK